MRLHRLEVEGFGPFRERQSVDFDAFADDGIFLIAGRTGAGKSSILDAVCFGLYGGVPRYEGGEKRLRSDHCEPDDLTEVVVEFSTPGGRYRVTRSPDYERPKKRGGGMTTQPASVRLDELVGDEWVTLAAKEREAAYELDEILQLSREQFLQVILLAQNRFSEFLLANSKDRQSLLRRLFGTERFEDVQRRFDELRRAAEHALGARLATVTARVEEAERLVAEAQLAGGAGAESAAPDAPWAAAEDASAADMVHPPAITTEERLEDLRRAAARADYRAERRASERADAEQRSVAADAALSAVREDRRAQQERDRARAAMAALDAAEPDISAARTELVRARAAESLRSAISAAGRARDALAASVDHERSAREKWDAFGIAVEAAPDAAAEDASDDAEELRPAEAEALAEALQAWSSALTKETGAWQRAREREEEIPELIARAEASGVLVETASARVEELARERAELPAELAAVTLERDDVRRRADRAPDLAAARDAAAARLSAAKETARLVEEHRVAAEAVVSAGHAVTEAQNALTGLRRRRLDGFAGELAAALVRDEPCPVCGSREHPQPAERTDAVSAEDVESAEAVRDAALARERKASERAAELNAALAAASTRADGRDEEQAAAEVETATAELEKSLAAARSAEALDARIVDLTARIERLESERAAADAALAAAREQHALALRERSEAESLVAEARGSFSTVAERLSHSATQAAAARTLAEAIVEVSRRSEAASASEEELAAALAASDFDDVAAAESALRSPAEQAALDARITTHAVQREKEREILFDLELRTLPEDPIDLAPAEEASAAAREAWTAAVDEAARAAGVAQRLTGLIESAASEHERTAADAEEFEVIRDLADTIAGRGANTRKMTLETFVLAAELEEIVDAANRRLHDMSAGRYQLRHSDALAARGAASGLGIVVFDAFTGQTRPAQSLSGGETFLSSLALALGLAEVVTARAGGIRLDTLFIDEGFGSLDGDTLDVAMRTLDELRQGGRTVGVISHVEAMQEQIPAQLTVRATSEGPSIIEAR